MLVVKQLILISTMHDNDPEVGVLCCVRCADQLMKKQILELEKNRNLRGIQHKTSTPHAHAPGWNEHLASASEASIKVCTRPNGFDL